MTSSNGNEATNVKADIVKQVEYYFGDFNLPQDKFLQEKIKEKDGWVDIDTMLNFKRLAKISNDPQVILDALKGSSKLMEVNVENKEIRRSQDFPLPEHNDKRREELTNQTVYCKGVNKNDQQDEVMVFFEAFENVVNVHYRTFKDIKSGERGFKGSVFVTFANRESAEKFMNLDKVEYKGTELIRKWQKDYTEEKIKEKEESVKQKLQRKKKAQEVKAAAEEAKAENKKDDFELPKGASLFITGMTNETTREDIKEVLKEKMNVEEPDYAYVYFNKGDTEGQVRFKKENFAKELIAKIPEEGLTIKDQKVEIKLLEGDEEKEFLSSCIASLQKRFGKKGHKRKGDSRGGRGGKRHRSN